MKIVITKIIAMHDLKFVYEILLFIGASTSFVSNMHFAYCKVEKMVLILQRKAMWFYY